MPKRTSVPAPAAELLLPDAPTRRTPAHFLQNAQCLRDLCRQGEALDGDDSTPVRQSLYDSPLTQWRHYATQLKGLRHQLVKADIEVES